jgi:hypothetical protein
LSQLITGESEKNGRVLEFLELLLDARGDAPAIRVGLDADDRRLRLDGIGQPRLQRVDEFLEPLVKGEFWRRLFRDFSPLTAFARAQNLAFDERTVFLFEGVEFGKGLTNGQMGGITRIDPGNEWIDGVIEEFAAEPAKHKLSKAFLDDQGGRAERKVRGATGAWR